MLPIDKYDPCWNEDKVDDELQKVKFFSYLIALSVLKNCCCVAKNKKDNVSEGRDVSPKAIENSTRPRKIITSDDMWNIGNQLAKQWCDAIQNLSLPAFNGQINLLKRMIEGAKKNEVVVFGNLF